MSSKVSSKVTSVVARMPVAGMVTPCDPVVARHTLARVECRIVLQKVPSEDDPEVRNHGEGPSPG